MMRSARMARSPVDPGTNGCRRGRFPDWGPGRSWKCRQGAAGRQIDRSGTLSCLHHHDIALVVLGRGHIVNGLLALDRMAFEVVAAHADLVTDEFVAELEGIETVGTDRA